MRNNTFTFLSILLIGGLLCLGLDRWKSSPFPDKRGNISPVSNIRYSNRQQSDALLLPSSNTPIALPSYSGSLATARHRILPNGYSASSKVSSYGNGFGSSNGSDHFIYVSSSAQMHSTVGTGSYNIAQSGDIRSSINRNTKQNNATRNIAVLPTTNNKWLALVAETASDAETAQMIARNGSRIGYTTNVGSATGTRKRVPVYDDSDGKWYDDETGDEVHPGSNVPGLDPGGYTGQTITFGGKQYQWNGSEWVDVTYQPMPISGGLMIILVLAIIYAATKKYFELKKNINIKTLPL